MSESDVNRSQSQSDGNRSQSQSDDGNRSHSHSDDGIRSHSQSVEIHESSTINWMNLRSLLKVCVEVDSPSIIGARKMYQSMASQRVLQATPSPWEELMRKFSEEHKEECRSESFNIPLMMRSKKLFPTGSTYVGSWDVLGMSGYGTYTFPNGVVYEGDFSDGLFHGKGELRYPSGEILRGKWNKGVITSRKLIFADGLEYSETNWTYCRMPNRRYTIEYNHGLQPAGESYLTAEQPTRPIPDGCFDAGDGFYDTKTKMVHKYDDPTSILRSPSVHEQKWIIDNCRSASIEPVGPRLDLYEEWLGPQVNKGSEAGRHTPVQRGSAGKSTASFEDLYASKFMLCHRPTIYDERGRKVPRFSNEVIEN